MTNEQLLHLIHHGDEIASATALAQLVEQNRGFIYKFTSRYRGQHLEYGDLVSEAMIGLLTAARRFDASKGFLFLSYASHWMRQSISRALVNQDREIRLPAWCIKDRDNLARVVVSLDETLSTSENPGPLGDLMFDAGADPAELFARVALRDELEPALASLSERERRAIELRYGLQDDQERTLQEVGALMQMSREGARQILDRALCSLREQVSIKS